MWCIFREYELRLPRSEVDEVNSLRLKWTELSELAASVTDSLLKDRRSAFEQELDKQVKVSGATEEEEKENCFCFCPIDKTSSVSLFVHIGIYIIVLWNLIPNKDDANKNNNNNNSKNKNNNNYNNNNNISNNINLWS